MTSKTLQRFKSNGLAYQHIGEGKSLLFIHGVGLCSRSWYQQIKAFKDEYSVYAVNMPGHGESDLLAKANPTLNDYTEKLAQFIIDVIKQPVVLIGHSMGALLSLSLAKEYPELCLALVPMNAIYKRSENAKQSVRQRASQLTELSHADVCAPISRWFGDSPEKQEAMHAKLCSEWLLNANLEGYAAAYKIFAEEDGADTSTLSNVSMPVLYITGEQDINSNASMTKMMAKITPNSEYLIVEQSRHMTPLTHATIVNAAIKNFLQRSLETTRNNRNQA